MTRSELHNPLMPGMIAFVETAKEDAYAKLVESADPAEYVDRSLKLPLTAYEKSRAARDWMARTGYELKDIQYARNRHPHWKKKKGVGAGTRSRRRNAAFARNTKNRLNNKEIVEFVEMNRKDAQGRYLRKDYELARHFKLSIYGVQHLRRKLNKIQRIFRLMKVKPEKRIVFDYMAYSEKKLHSLYLKEKDLNSDAPPSSGGIQRKETPTWDQLWKV